MFGSSTLGYFPEESSALFAAYSALTPDRRDGAPSPGRPDHVLQRVDDFLLQYLIRASHVAFLVVPLVGAFFIDLLNTVAIRIFLSQH